MSQSSLEDVSTSKDAELAGDAVDRDLPRNWCDRDKLICTWLIALYKFISSLNTSSMAPGLDKIAEDLRIESQTVKAFTLSIYLFGYAFGPLFLAPLSETYGRLIVLRLSNLFFLIFNVAAGFSQNVTQMLVFRLLSGFGGSGPLALGGGILTDCWDAKDRARAISLYTLPALLGPAIGPICGGFVAEKLTWRWSFFALSIASAVVQIIGFFFLRETWVPVIIHRRHAREDGIDQSPPPPLGAKLKENLLRPLKMLHAHPVIHLLTIYIAFVYGLMYLALLKFPSLWITKYKQSPGRSGLNYISIAVGLTIASQTTARLNKRIYSHLLAKSGKASTDTHPEFRLPMIAVGSVLLPTGLLIYGWAAEYTLFWLVPNIGMVIFAAGVVIISQCSNLYLVDTYQQFAASAISAATVLRSLAGIGFPLFASQLYAGLGYGWGNSTLAFAGIVIGWPLPFLCWRYGARLRRNVDSA